MSFELVLCAGSVRPGLIFTYLWRGLWDTSPHFFVAIYH